MEAPKGVRSGSEAYRFDNVINLEARYGLSQRRSATDVDDFQALRNSLKAQGTGVIKTHVRMHTLCSKCFPIRICFKGGVEHVERSWVKEFLALIQSRFATYKHMPRV